MRHHITRATAALATALLMTAVAACTQVVPAQSTQAISSASPSASPSESAAPDPATLTGTWVVTDTGTAADGTTVRLEASVTGRGTAEITADCGTISGSWGANSRGMFLGSVYAWSANCDTQKGATTEIGVPAQIVAWLTTATTFELLTTSSTPTVTLTNSAGADIATLVSLQDPDSKTASPTSGATPPTAAFEPPTSTTLEELEGKWVQEGRPHVAPTPPFLQFTADGAWDGSDGCNAASGRWLANTQGALLATSGPTTQISCDGMVDMGRALVQASFIGVIDDELYLWDAAGTIILRLVPETPPTSATPSSTSSPNSSSTASALGATPNSVGTGP